MAHLREDGWGGRSGAYRLGRPNIGPLLGWFPMCRNSAFGIIKRRKRHYNRTKSLVSKALDVEALRYPYPYSTDTGREVSGETSTVEGGAKKNRYRKKSLRALRSRRATVDFIPRYRTSSMRVDAQYTGPSL